MTCYRQKRRVPIKKYLVGDSIPIDDIEIEEEVFSSQDPIEEQVQNLNLGTKSTENRGKFMVLI